MTTRTLILVRHAAAGSSSSGDRQRPLTPEGVEQARRLGRRVSRLIDHVDLSLTSPAVRTQETAVQLHTSIEVRTTSVDDELYLAGADSLLDKVRSLPASVTSVMMVGHEPAISAMAASLGARRSCKEKVRWGVPTGTAVVLTFEGNWSQLAENSCEMEVFREPA